ncbi:response regulator transcription factor [Lutimonas zeaxanthinifaciens]|uniref:response regulator transcription factor n=1 Tax=Lutimonas zeaxanthinifaciens TaxID=3060215 RepID=UPI00265CCDF4|nr:response regulator transcription factor [Lutimonas sp. YSD2104]WKK65864.1 response regulator transcription factor [Lutimonas sp. YSD2104]
MNISKIRTVLVDDEERALNRMKILLSNFEEIEVLEAINDSEYAINYIMESDPDLVFLDIEMPLKTGLEVAEEINKHNLKTKIIFMTAHEHYAIKAIKKEAFDYLLKPIGIDELKVTLERFLSKTQTLFTKRELEIVNLICKGMSSKEIGKNLSISHHTVDTHRRKILEKSECHNAVELIMYATKNHLI